VITLKKIEVKIYKDIEWWLQLFLQQKIPILMLISRAGLGKTEMVENTLKDIDYGYVNSHVSPLALYEIGYRYRNKPIVIDDIDSIMHDEDNVSLLKQYAETKPVKKIRWKTTSATLEGLGLPQEFDTTSNIMFIGNKIKNIDSLADRGFCLFFNPTRQERIRKIEEIANDMKIEKKKKEEVIEMLKTHRGEITLRTFIKALNLHGENRWKEWLLKDMQISEKTMICEMIVKNFPRESWLEAWKFSAHSYGDEWSRTNFYYHLRQLNFDDKEIENFNIEKTLESFKNSIVSNGVKKAGWTVGHPVKTQNLWDLSQNKKVEVSNKLSNMRGKENADKKEVWDFVFWASHGLAEGGDHRVSLQDSERSA
jgi:hypothetical protein